MKTKERIRISKEIKEDMKQEIQNYFSHEREEELGDLAASFFLDFILEKLGPEIYNQGISDAYKLIKERSEDLLALQLY